MTDSYLATRDQLRGLAESLIAGPQFRAAGTVRLAVRPAGFAGTALPIEIQGTDLVWPDGRLALTGTLAEIGDAAGLTVGPPEGSYAVTDPLPPDQALAIDPGAADTVYRSLYAGGQAVVEFAPDQHPVLWPEHFDVAVTVDEVNYGLSPGDAYHPGPYAYVGPWTARSGEFWNAPFGAALPIEVAGRAENAVVDTIVAFFERGRSQL